MRVKLILQTRTQKCACKRHTYIEMCSFVTKMGSIRRLRRKIEPIFCHETTHFHVCVLLSPKYCTAQQNSQFCGPFFIFLNPLCVMKVHITKILRPYFNFVVIFFKLKPIMCHLIFLTIFQFVKRQVFSSLDFNKIFMEKLF